MTQKVPIFIYNDNGKDGDFRPLKNKPQWHEVDWAIDLDQAEKVNKLTRELPLMSGEQLHSASAKQ